MLEIEVSNVVVFEIGHSYAVKIDFRRQLRLGLPILYSMLTMGIQLDTQLFKAWGCRVVHVSKKIEKENDIKLGREGKKEREEMMKTETGNMQLYKICDEKNQTGGKECKK